MFGITEVPSSGSLVQCLAKITRMVLSCPGTAVAQWLRRCATNRKVAGSIPAGVSGFFIHIKSFRSHYGPGVDSASNINEYQVYFLGGKCGRCLRLTTYHHPVPLSRNLGILTSWNPLGHSRPVTGLIYLFFIVSVDMDKVGVMAPYCWSTFNTVRFKR